MGAMAFGAPAVRLRSLRPAPPHSNMGSGMLGIALALFFGQRFVINLFWLIHQNASAPAGEGKGNAQQVLQTLSEFTPAFPRNKEEHETASTSAQQLAAKSAGAAPELV